MRLRVWVKVRPKVKTREVRLSLAQSVAPAFAVAQHGDAAPADDGVQPVA